LVAAKKRTAEARASGDCGLGPDYDDADVASIDHVLSLLREEKSKAGPPLTWAAIWGRTLAHAKAVYLPTFVAGAQKDIASGAKPAGWTTPPPPYASSSYPLSCADCVVWPPLQLINFTFVPLQYRVLYVNVANLFWNTFLSLQANKSH
jgi:hypothetical protein